MFSPLIAFIFGGRPDSGVSGSCEKLADLFKSLDLLNIHDDVHPAIMGEARLIVKTHFILESQHPVQTHFILEEVSEGSVIKPLF